MAKTKKAAETGNEKQATLPGADETIKAEIAKYLTAGKEYETARIEAGREEKKNKAAAQSLMEKYNMENFVYGEGADRVTGFFEQQKKLKVRLGDSADAGDEEDEE